MYNVPKIRGMSIADALAQMQFCEKKPSKFIELVNLTAFLCATLAIANHATIHVLWFFKPLHLSRPY